MSLLVSTFDMSLPVSSVRSTCGESSSAMAINSDSAVSFLIPSI